MTVNQQTQLTLPASRCWAVIQGLGPPSKWVWLKTKHEEQTAEFGSCFHLSGQAIWDPYLFWTHSQIGQHQLGVTVGPQVVSQQVLLSGFKWSEAGRNTVDGQNPAPFRNPGTMVFLELPTKKGLPWFLGWGRISQPSNQPTNQHCFCLFFFFFFASSPMKGMRGYNERKP